MIVDMCVRRCLRRQPRTGSRSHTETRSHGAKRISTTWLARVRRPPKAASADAAACVAGRRRTLEIAAAACRLSVESPLLRFSVFYRFSGAITSMCRIIRAGGASPLAAQARGPRRARLRVGVPRRSLE